MQHLSYQTTKDLFSLLQEKGVEWQPVTFFYIFEYNKVRHISNITTNITKEPYQPALNALHLLELTQLVFGGVELSGVPTNLQFSTPDPKYQIVYTGYKEAIQKVFEGIENGMIKVGSSDQLLPQTQAAVLIRRYFESGKVLTDLDFCFEDLIKEIKAL